MNGNTELVITVPVAMIAITFTMLNMLITMYLMRSFFSHVCRTVNQIKNENAINQQRNAHSNNEPQTELTDTPYNKVASYFKYTALITLIFNTLCSLFHCIYCMYLVFDPAFDDTMFYVYHPSHIYRILSTVCWYIAQVSLIYVFTGRLYYTFHGGPYSVNKRFIICINAFNTTIVFTGLACGYYGVYVGNLILAEIGLNLISRVVYEVISFIVLYMFSSRLLILTIRNESKSRSRPMSVETAKQMKIPSKSIIVKPNIPVVEEQKSETIDPPRTQVHIEKEKMFLTVTTRNAILMMSVSVSVLMVTVCYFGFRFIFGTQSRLTLLIPMNMAAFDTVNTSICILCCFRYGKKFYYKLCGACDIKCKRICLKIARNYY